MRHPIAALDGWWEATAATRRIDHYPANLCLLAGLVCSTGSIVLQGPSPSSVLVGMNDRLQIAMCACILIGCATKLHGVLCHTRIWFPNKPLIRCYQLGYTGAPIASGGLFVYGFYILSNTPTWLSAVGGVLTPCLGLGVLLQGGVYWLESRRIGRRQQHMISIAKQVKGMQDSL